jgi:iron complex transport system substrate-binding protein
VRVVSLLPSATDIVRALGLDDELVGVTFECDEDARSGRTVVVGGLDTTGLAPGEIDAYVRANAGAGLYELHADALAGLDPDLILTQDLCRVCAVPAGQVDAALAHLGCRAAVVTLDPHTLDDVLASILLVGARTGAEEQARLLLDRLTARLAAVRAAVAGRPRPRVAVVEWVDPPFPAGHWVPDLVTAAGGIPVAAVPGGRSAPTTFAAMAAESPDLVVVAPCGFDLAGAVAQAGPVVEAFPGVPVWGIDADRLVVRPGPGLVDGVEALAAILHPDAIVSESQHAVAQVTPDRWVR